MGKQVTGTATIRVDGKELAVLDGATLNIGGFNREVVKGGGRIHGFSEEVMEPTMEATLVHTKNLSLIEMGDITDATVLFNTDSGVQYILRGAFTTEPMELSSDSGEAPLKMAALHCDEVSV